MVYIKINNKVFNCADKKALADYLALNSTIKEYSALNRVIESIKKRYLNDYPEIDIVINTKNIHTILGRFSVNLLIKHKEYKFIKGNNPYIVLFWHAIESYYCKHAIKGLTSVLLHEYGHFKQWLLNDKLEHKKGIHPEASGNAVIDLNQHLAYINQSIN